MSPKPQAPLVIERGPHGGFYLVRRKRARQLVGDPRFRLLFLAVVLTLCGALLALSGCGHAPPPSRAVLVAPESQAARARESAISAHVAQAAEDNQLNAPSLARQAVNLQLQAARVALPLPELGDAQRAAALSAAAHSGNAAKAQAASAEAHSHMAALTQEHTREREARALELERTISHFNAELKAAGQEANRQAQLRITTTFALLGGGVTLLGVVSAVTGWSRVGLSLIPAGVALGGSGLLWGRPWFLYTVGGSLALCCVAVGLLWAVQVSRNRKQPL